MLPLYAGLNPSNRKGRHKKIPNHKRIGEEFFADVLKISLRLSVGE
jgi:hypothetical protein